VRTRDQAEQFWRAFPLLRVVAILIGSVLVGTGIVELLKHYAPQTVGLPLPLPARVERPCGPASDRTAVIVMHGQSNAANYGSTRHTAREAVDNFDPASGKCFAAIDPLLGTDGYGGNVATRLGDIVIQSRRYDRVIIVPLARGGASMTYLNNEGTALIADGITKLKAAGLTPTHILFQQGEADAASTTTAEEYASQLRRLVKQFRTAGVDAPFYLSRGAKCDYLGPGNIAAVRAGQLAAIDETLNIRPGPDTDTIGNEGRVHDGCHMNEAGTLANAALWAAFIK
jgi:hypothetical protein